jgi:hypothetical protein
MRKIIHESRQKNRLEPFAQGKHKNTQNSLGLVKLQETFDNMNEDYVFPFFYYLFLFFAFNKPDSTLFVSTTNP